MLLVNVSTASSIPRTSGLDSPQQHIPTLLRTECKYILHDWIYTRLRTGSPWIIITRIPCNAILLRTYISVEVLLAHHTSCAHHTSIGGLDILPRAKLQSKTDLDLAWSALDWISNVISQVAKCGKISKTVILIRGIWCHVPKHKFELCVNF